MNAPIKRWECGRCGEVHDDWWEAEECCQPTVSEVWECGVCGECYDDRDEALKCCLAEEQVAEVAEEGARQFPPPYQEPEIYIQEFMRLNHLVGAPKPEASE